MQFLDLPQDFFQEILDILFFQNNSFSALTATCKILRIKYESETYWKQRVSCRFSSSVSLMVLSSAFDIHSSVVSLQQGILQRSNLANQKKDKTELEPSFSPATIWKYIYICNKCMNADVVSPEHCWTSSKSRKVIPRLSLSPSSPLSDYNDVHQFLLLLQNRLIAKWPWLAVSFSEKVDNINYPFISDRYQHYIPHKAGKQAIKEDEAEAKYPSIRFLNGGHYGQGGLYTYSDVLEFYIVSSKQIRAQEEELKTPKEETTKKVYRNRDTEGIYHGYKFCQEEEDNQKYFLEIIYYRLQDEREEDIRLRLSLPLPSLSPTLLNESHSFLNSIFSSLQPFLAIFMFYWKYAYSTKNGDMGSFNNTWKLLSTNNSLFSDKLEKRESRGVQAIINSTIGDVMACHHVLRTKIRNHLDSMLVEDTTNNTNNNNNNNNNQKIKQKTAKPSKTIEVAIERFIRRHTKFFVKDFFSLYLWDKDEPALALLLDAFATAPKDDGYYKEFSYLGHEMSINFQHEREFKQDCLFNTIRGYISCVKGFETVPPNSLFLLPFPDHSIPVSEFFMNNSWHSWPLGIKAFAFDMMPLIFKWIQAIIRSVIEKISKQKSNNKEETVRDIERQFGKQRIESMPKESNRVEETKQAILKFIAAKKNVLQALQSNCSI